MDARSLTIVLLICFLIVASSLTFPWWFPPPSTPIPMGRP